MNSLNLLSARVIGQSNPDTSSKGRPRSRSEGNANIGNTGAQPPKRSASQHVENVTRSDDKELWSSEDEGDKIFESNAALGEVDEKTPLLEEQKPLVASSAKYNKLHLVAKRLVDALTASLRWVLSALTAPGVYVVTCFYDDKGRFSPFSPARKLGRVVPKRTGRKSTAQAVGLSASPDHSPTSSTDGRNGHRKPTIKVSRRKADATASIISAISSESEADPAEKEQSEQSTQSSRPKAQPSSSSEEVPARRSIRIKLYNDDTARRRRQKKSQNSTASGLQAPGTEKHPPLTMATIKSPTSPASSLRLTKYPRSPAPPRPLVPRRQPSYSLPTARSSSRLAQKTLVIDLDETLIHSLAKGGRMSSGHMVEVKLSSTVGYGGTTLGPQHPILYYVHKRPHCDDFLRKVCKWYNLVVFTASVQEYADPVIDWLEQERQYFSGRYYRQHCTFRNGAYIKDLSSVEPDLSKVMILDNSPLSYIFHEGKLYTRTVFQIYGLRHNADNAIPIEGWINDPTDNDLLHLIPLLEALQYVTDVRALLALRRGQAEISQ